MADDPNERRMPTGHGPGGWFREIANRPKLTAAGLRALGRAVPKHIPDDAVIVLVTTKENS